MRLDGFGVPSTAALAPCVREVAEQMASCCREWLASPSRRRRLPLIRLLAGAVLLGRLTRNRQLEQMARAAFRRFGASDTPMPPADRAAPCLALLQFWHWQPEATRRYRQGLEHLRGRALGELRAQRTDAAVTPLTQRYVALARLWDDGTVGDGMDTAGAACRRLLAENGCDTFRAAAGRRLYALIESLATAPGEARRIILYRLARELLQLTLAARLCRVDLPVALIRQMNGLVMLHLRTMARDWPDHSLSVVIRLALVLQSWLAGEGVPPDLKLLLRDSGCFYRDWPRISASRLQLSTRADEVLSTGVEIRTDVMAIARLARQPMRGRELAPICARLSKLHLNLHALGRPGLAWWADGLQQSLLALLQTSRVAGAEWRGQLRCFRERVLMPNATVTPADRLDAALSEVRVVTARAVVSAVSPASAREAGAIREPVPGRTSLIGQLSSELRCIPDPEPWLRMLANPDVSGERADRLRTVRQELELLETGARALGVYRVEALARVLSEVYRHPELMTMEGGAGGPDTDLIEALRRGHAGLLHRLDQAAAWQEVSRPRPVIERLYRSLEARRGAANPAVLSARQRCLALNRRVVELLTSASSTAALRERRTLLATLLRDQARLLREDW